MISISIIFLTLLFSAFFSGMEIAFVSSNKLKLEIDKKQHSTFSKIINIFLNKPSDFIATMLVGNNISLVIYGITMAVILRTPIAFIVNNNEALILLLQTIISTIIILFTAEYLPKTLFRSNPNKALKVFIYPVYFMYILLYPITKIIMFFSNFLLKNILNINIDTAINNPVFVKADIDYLVTNLSKEDEQEELDNDIKLFQNALDFSEVKIRECIIPRTEVVAIDINDFDLEKIKQLFIESGFSKILVFNDSIDNIIGYIHNADLFKKPQDLKSIIRNVIIVPETMPANKLLKDFSSENKSMAVVVDEFGGTAGIVTLEDIMEEIFGEIEDEYDTSQFIDKKISDNEFIFSGRLEIDLINEKYDLGLPDSDDFETVAGWILYHYENIPKLNQVIEIDNFRVKILEVSNIKIGLINLIKNE
jgi:CBS domain containing-hemolysin-like protein